MAGFTYKNTKAFTLAETLISLVVIGIVAALVIPSVLKNYNDRKYNTARLKALKTFGEAGRMASVNGEINGQPTARAFVENVLSKYLKITKICDNNKASECNFPTKVKSFNSSTTLTSNNVKAWNGLCTYRSYGGEMEIANTDLSVYITTVDGYSAKVFYNPKCSNDVKSSVIDMTCINIVYDMNGTKGPNHAGEDVGFVTTFLSGLKSISVAPGLSVYSSSEELTHPQGNQFCTEKSTNNEKYSLPSIEEGQSLFINSNLSSIGAYSLCWTTKRCSPSQMCTVYNSKGDVIRFARYDWLKACVKCVRR